MRIRVFHILVLLLVLFSVTGCGSPTAPADQGSNATGSQQPSAVSGQNAISPAATPTKAIEIIEKSVQLVGEPQFVQVGSTTSVTFKIKNPDPTYSVEAQYYKVILYDKDRGVIKDSRRWLALVLPNEERGVVSNLYVESETPVDHVEVQLEPGRGVKAEINTAPFTIEDVQFESTAEDVTISGKLKNNLGIQLNSVDLAILAFDKAGKYVGGEIESYPILTNKGFAYLNLSTEIAATAEKVELYPSLKTRYSMWPSEEIYPDMKVLSTGKMKNEYSEQVFFVIQNTSQAVFTESTEVGVALFDEENNQIGTESIYVSNIEPGGKAAKSISINPVEGLSSAAVEVAVIYTRPLEIENVPSLTSEEVSFESTDSSVTVTGKLVNPSSQRVGSVLVSAAAYDASDTLIGMGMADVDFLPANGKMPMVITFDVSAPVEKVELIANLQGDLTESVNGTSEKVRFHNGYWQGPVEGKFEAFILVKNTSTEVLEKTRYDLTFLNEKDEIVATSSGTIRMIFPGDSGAAFVTFETADGKLPSKMNVDLIDGQPATVKLTENPFTVTDPESGAFEGKLITRTNVTNNSDQDANWIEVYGFVLDPDGKMVDFNMSEIYDLSAGETTLFEMKFDDTGLEQFSIGYLVQFSNSSSIE